MPDDNTVPIAAVVAAVDDEITDIDEALAQIAIVNREHYSELLEKVNQCHERLETLSTKLDQSQSSDPVSQRILEELMILKEQLVGLKTEVSALQSSSQLSPQPSVSVVNVVPEVTPPTNPSPEGPEPGESTEEPARVAEPEPLTPKPRKYKVI